MTDTRFAPPRSTSETRMTQEGQTNAGGQRRTDDDGKAYYDPAPLTEYPRMMYKATDAEQTQPWADQIADLKDKPMVINRFGGLLCETMIAHDAAEAEVLATNGWDISPEAAHGIVAGKVAEVTAKDERIAELEALLAAQVDYEGSETDSGFPDSARPRRGRPPKQPIDA